MSRFRIRMEPLLRPFFHMGARLGRGTTLGVRGMVFDDLGRILLVRHTYIAGWHLPGGGVERGQTGEAALIAEMAQEAGVEVIDRPRLISIHDNSKIFPHDHILLYHVPKWRPCEATAHFEIAEVDWFAPDGLLDGATRATRARLRERLEKLEPDPLW